MYKFYKTINKGFFFFGKVLLAAGIVAVICGLFYLIFISIVFTQYEVTNILDNFVIFYYLAYCLLAIQTGISLIDAYTNYGLKKSSKKNSFLEIKIEK